MIRRPPRSTPLYSSAASDVYKRQLWPTDPNPAEPCPRAHQSDKHRGLQRTEPKGQLECSDLHRHLSLLACPSSSSLSVQIRSAGDKGSPLPLPCSLFPLHTTPSEEDGRPWGKISPSADRLAFTGASTPDRLLLNHFREVWQRRRLPRTSRRFAYPSHVRSGPVSLCIVPRGPSQVRPHPWSISGRVAHHLDRPPNMRCSPRTGPPSPGSPSPRAHPLPASPRS